MAEPRPFRHGLFFRIIYPLLHLFAILLLSLFGPIWVKGRRHMPKQGGVLILANHLADIDPVMVHLASPRLVHFMTKSELFDMPILGSIIRFFKGFPVKRGTPDRTSIKRAVELLKAGEVVCIFPEGQLSATLDLLPILPGAALVAKMAKVPVICCGLRHTNRVMPYGKFVPRPSFIPVTAELGEPKTFGPDVTVEEITEWAGAEISRLTGQKRLTVNPNPPNGH